MPLFYPSFQALKLADAILDTVGARVPGYQGRLGAAWYWRLTGGVLVTVQLDYTVTEQRWDVLRAQATSPNVGLFNAADFPFAAYGTLLTSPPYIHDLDGEAEWANRLYFQMGYLIDDLALWLDMLRATLIEPAIHPPAAFPQLTALERELVRYAIDNEDGVFNLETLAQAFAGRISKQRLRTLARHWETLGLLTERPRRVTVALRALAEHEE